MSDKPRPGSIEFGERAEERLLRLLLEIQEEGGGHLANKFKGGEGRTRDFGSRFFPSGHYRAALRDKAEARKYPAAITLEELYAYYKRKGHAPDDAIVLARKSLARRHKANKLLWDSLRGPSGLMHDE